jgi:LacI family transcriptional regulator
MVEMTKKKKASPKRPAHRVKFHIPRVAVLLHWDSIVSRNIRLGIARYVTACGPWKLFTRYGDAFKPLGRLDHWDGDGIIAATHDEKFAEEVRSSGKVAVNISQSPGFPNVTIDSVAVGRLAAEYLIKQGHKRFGYYGVGVSNHSWQERAGFIEAIRQAGVTEDIYEPALKRMPVKWKIAQKLLVRWLPLLPKPIGIMACDDGHGRQVIEAARECGVLVPEELAVIGVANEEMICEFCNPPLSSITVQGERIGYEAAKLLDHLMAGGSPPETPILIPPGEVIVRRSSDMLAVADVDLAAAVRFIRENGNRPITVTDVLNEVAISRRPLERRFRKFVGHSPWREIRLTQISHVKKLLIETDMSMPKVAAASAFYDAKRLSTIFKEEMGVTPTAYRRQFRNV